jgi:YD repeat-containing protein
MKSLPNWIIRFSTALLFVSVFTVWLGAADTMKYRYDAAGRLVQVDFGEGKRIEYVYDRAGNVLSRSIIAFTDSDSDRLDDDWERKHFGDLGKNGQADSDGDGQSDLREFLSGTNPADAKSVLQIIRPELASGTVRILWQAEPGRRYRVEFKRRLEAQEWVQLASDVVPQTAIGSVTAPMSAEDEQRYYRVVMIP